jgi:hypothetical protein
MISLADLKLYIGALEDGDDADDVLAGIEERAVELVSRATGMFLGASSTHTFFASGDGSAVLWLPAEVSAVATVEVRPTLASAYETLDSDAFEFNTSEYAFYKSQRLLRVDGSAWPEGDALIRLTVTRGYATDTEPPAIRQLVMDLVNFHYRAGRKLFLESGGSPDVSQVPGWDRVIAMYRAPNYA